MATPVIWLPLNGDLRNIGSLGNSVIITNGNTTVNDNGKMGKCYSFNGSNSYLMGSVSGLSNATTEYTFACWLKLNNTSHTGCLFSDRTAVNTTGFSIFYAGGQLYFDDGERWSFTPATALAANTWYHICFTWKKGNSIKYYCDGVLKNSTTTTHTPSIVATQFSFGRSQESATTVGGNYLNGYINDFRIYNEALSPKEIKEIAKGLMIHYPLNGYGNTLLPFGYQQLEYIESAGAAYINTNYRFNAETENCKVIFKGNDTANTGMIFASSGGKYFWIYYYGSSGIRIYADNGSGQQGIAGISSDLNKHTAEYKNKHYYIDGVDKGSLSNTYTETSNPIYLFSYGGANYPFKGRLYYAEITKNNNLIRCYIPAKRISDSAIGVYEIVNNEFFISNSSTAFTAGSVIATPTLIYDTSGYNNNGTPSRSNNLILNKNGTARYSSSIESNGDYSYIRAEPLFGELTTVSMWVNFKSISQATNILFADNESKLCLNLWMGNRIICCTGVAGDVFTCNTINTNTWYHIVVIKTGETSRILYINGVKYNTPSLQSNSNTDSGVYVGGYKNICLTGSMSDFRGYATMLSDADVLELYHTPYSIDNLGQGHGYEYQESSNLISIQKNGIIKEDELNEVITLSDGSMWLPIMVHDNRAGTNLFSSSDDFTKLVYHNDDCWAEFPLINSAPRPDSSKYEFLVYQRPTDDENFQRFRWTQTNNPLSTTAVAGLTILEGGTANGGGICKKNSNTYFATGSSNWWNACGCWTKYGTGIPGFNGVTINRELLLFMRVSSNNYRDIKNSFVIGTSFLEI